MIEKKFGPERVDLSNPCTQVYCFSKQFSSESRIFMRKGDSTGKETDDYDQKYVENLVQGSMKTLLSLSYQIKTKKSLSIEATILCDFLAPFSPQHSPQKQLYIIQNSNEYKCND